MAWLYHVFCLSYKWTIDEVDAVEMPMLFCLMEQIGETPPQDFLVNAQMKAAAEKVETEKKGALGQFEVTKGKVRRRTGNVD